MDELDQSDVSARGNSSGNPVAKNLFNQLLQFLGDPTNRGKVVFFGASNRPDLMDPALMRSGRVDAIIPILLPEQPERGAIALATAARLGIRMWETAANIIAAETDKYSAADIAQLVIKAAKLARRAGQDEIGPSHIDPALRSFRPATPAKADYFTALAVEACNDTDLLPDRYKGLLDDRKALNETIKAQEPTAADGRNSGRYRREM